MKVEFARHVARCRAMSIIEEAKGATLERLGFRPISVHQQVLGSMPIFKAFERVSSSCWIVVQDLPRPSTTYKPGNLSRHYYIN